MLNLDIINENGLSYVEYLELTKTSVENKNPRGGENMLGYTELNERRMARIEKTLEINDKIIEALNNLNEEYVWMLISEPWCGDAAQNLPVIAKIAESSNGKIDLKIILRDDHPEIMDLYLTNGGKSVPKMACFKKSDFSEQFVWGPRPAVCQQIVIDWKAAGGENKEQMLKDVQTWYAKDKSQSLQIELAEKIKALN
ncbi:thioredoxin family protein [Aureibacter tunicatorum]|uniref:Thioredoxin-like negative regulator of GroEL n=1 Tax=Aureibacter tunicatorum TaxID=866807 RepID=A0AAE4BSC4_9BACT|nr:thioredoxin family protein [Aureibacter tunicatorum]MDR6238720.1 thioredoxin-like negative regulator of GroEL [Aureibacter tunicatorum]BDD05349.1 thioredoxin [Aureibacter tunicatorum]